MNQTFAIIGALIAQTGLLAGMIGLVWKSLDQRFNDLEKNVNQRIDDQGKLFEAKLETIRVEIKQIGRPQIVRP